MASLKRCQQERRRRSHLDQEPGVVLLSPKLHKQIWPLCHPMTGAYVLKVQHGFNTHYWDDGHSLMTASA